MKNKNENKKQSIVDSILNTTPQFDGEIISDVQGSYTGVPLDGGQPVQDADDL